VGKAPLSPSLSPGGVEYLSHWRGRSGGLHTTTCSLLTITYLLYTAMLPSVPRWRLVSSAVSGQAWEREEISFAT
jgi:hypothetical protein